LHQQKQDAANAAALKAAPHGKTVINDDAKYEQAVLKIIGLCMLNAKTYLVGCSFDEPNFKLAFKYYKPSAVKGSNIESELRISGEDKIKELFLFFGYEPLQIKPYMKAKFRLSSFFMRVNVIIGEIAKNVGFFKNVNKTMQEPQTTIVERYNHDYGLFLKYLQKTGKNIDDLDNASAVANWIKDDIWNGYSEQDKMNYGIKKTMKQGGKVVETYEQDPDWARDEVNYYMYLAQVFKCVFEAQVIEVTASPPQPQPPAASVSATQPSVAAPAQPTAVKLPTAAQTAAQTAAPKQPQSAAQNEIVRLENEIAKNSAQISKEEQFVKDVIAKEGKDKAAKNQTVKQKLTIIKQYRAAIEQKKELIDALKKQDAAAGVISEAKSKLYPQTAAQSAASKPAAVAAPVAPTSAKQPALAAAAPGTVIQGNLLNKNSTMCYLDAAMQMLLAIPEIPQFFANITYEQISALEQITSQTDLILNGCAISNKTVEKRNIKLWKMIFDEVRTKPMVSIIHLSITLSNGTEIKPYAQLVLGCKKTNAFLTSDRRDYTQADPSELMTLLFFPNFSCLIIPSINETVGIIKEDTTTTKTHILSMMLYSDRYKSGTSIARLLESSAFGTLIPLQHGGNYLIMAINRAYTGDDGRIKKNQTRVEITREIDIVGAKFIIKGCIFHSGDGQGGHYVYGVYDDTGNPHHVIDDLRIATKAEDVFNQNRWMSTMFLYRRVQ